MPLPDAEGREAVLRIHTAAMPLADDVGLAGLAGRCDGWSGAQIGALCREAAMGALRGGIDTPLVEARHFEEALRRVHGVT